VISIGPHVVDWVAKRTNEYGNFGAAQGIGWLKDGNLVAGVAYAEWNGPNVVCHIASDGSRRWATRQYLWTIFDYPFNQLNANRITVCVGEGNGNSRRFVEKLGFAVEATLKEAHPTGDLIVYRMWKSECRFIAKYGDYSPRNLESARATSRHVLLRAAA
jgi:RimJ/RimL family protein N-acetyltransferase